MNPGLSFIIFFIIKRKKSHGNSRSGMFETVFGLAHGFVVNLFVTTPNYL